MTLQLANIVQGTQLDPEERFDLVLGFAGSDDRSVKNLREVQSKADQCWVFTQRPLADHSATSVEQVQVRLRLEKLGKRYSHRTWSEDSSAREICAALSSMTRDRELRVFVDVSAFPRSFLAAVLDSIRASVVDGARVNLTLAYRLAQFSKPSDRPAPPNRRVAPVHRNTAGWPRMPGLPVHLIVGLGYERGKALGAVEYIQPARLSLFFPDSPEPRFAKQVRERNHELLEGIPEESIFHYPVMDPAAQLALLSSLLQAMVTDSKPILLPFGPKIFFAICLLASFRFSEVSVWHVSGEEDEPALQVRPSSSVTFASVSLLPSASPL
jgi:hypothetical protein